MFKSIRECARFFFFRFEEFSSLYEVFYSFNPFTSRSDQYVNSPYNNFNTLSSREVMRIKKNQVGDIVLI